MFQLLTEYLLEFKKIIISGVGRFELESTHASAGFDKVEAPGWNISFKEYKRHEPEELNTGSFYSWLAQKEQVSVENARQIFEEFSRNTVVKLNDNEKVVWDALGTLEKTGTQIQFTPFENAVSPFNSIAAEKVIREDASHQLLIGEKETSSAAVREQYLEEEPERNSGKKIAWVVVAIAVLAAAIYFLKRGCSLQSAANQQKTTIQKPADTYQLK